MFSLFKKPDHEVAVIFDIGNGSIGGALVSFKAREMPIILYSHREPLTYQQDTDSKHQLGIMLKLLQDVAKIIQSEGLPYLHRTLFGRPTISNIFCVFTSPWYVGETKRVYVKKDKSIVINGSVFKSLIDTEHNEFSKRLEGSDYQNQFGPLMRLMERQIINTKLNGYDVTSPTGKQADEIDITCYFSVIADEVAAGVEAVLHKTFHYRYIHYSSYSFASWQALREIYPDKTNYLYIDVTGETTEVNLIIKGVLVEMSSFPIGRSRLIKEAAAKLNVPPEVAISHIGLKGAGMADEKYGAAIHDMSRAIGGLWLSELHKVLSKYSSSFVLPKEVFLTSEHDVADQFCFVLRTEAPVRACLA